MSFYLNKFASIAFSEKERLGVKYIDKQFVGEISDVYRDQAVCLEVVERYFQDINPGTQKNALPAEDHRAAAGALTQQAVKFRAEITKFRIA